MEIQSDNDFKQLRQYIVSLSKRFPMFRHDVAKIEKIIEEHIKNHSIAMVNYRQTHSRSYLEKAQQEINEINRVLQLVGKIELMSLLSQR